MASSGSGRKKRNLFSPNTYEANKEQFFLPGGNRS